MDYHAGGRPAYLRIADRLRRDIADGLWAPGERLPSANELAEQFKSTRATVASAVEVLRREGLLFTQQGRGAFVRQREPLRLLDFAHGERAAGAPLADPSLEELGVAPTYRLISVGVEPASADVAERLGLSKGERVLARRFLMLGGDLPLELLASFFSDDFAADTRFVEPEPVDTYRTLIEEFGVRLSHFLQDIRSRMPAPDEARLLDLGPGDTILQLIRTAYDDGDRPVNVLDAVLPGSRHLVRHRIPVGVLP
jgi:GntR family transcriptional regulator